MTDEQPNTPPAVPENTPKKLRPRDFILMLVVVPAVCLIAGLLSGAGETDDPSTLQLRFAELMWVLPIVFALALTKKRGESWGLAIALSIVATVSGGVTMFILLVIGFALEGF